MKKLKFSVTNYEVSIFPLCSLAEMLYRDFHKMAGKNWSNFEIGLWQNRVNRWALDPSNKKAISLTIKNKVQKDPQFLFKVRQNIFSLSKELVDFSFKFKKDLSKKTDREILDLYNEYIKRYKEMYLWGWVPNAIEAFRNSFTKSLENFLRRKLKKLGKEDLVGEYFSVLLTPKEKSVRQEAEEELLEIAKEAVKLKLDNPKVIERLRQRQQKYTWLEFNYEGKPLTVEYFLGELEKIVKSGEEPKILLQRIEKQRREIMEKQKICAKEIGLDSDKMMGKFFDAGREMQFLKDYRKNIAYQSYYYLDFLIREMARRLNLTPTQTRHILPWEMEKVLLKKININDLNERIKYSALIYEKDKIRILTGEKARKYIVEHTEEEKIKKIKELKGQCVYPGKVKGSVKLIFQREDIGKMQEGDILISVKTDPSLLPAMRKASAIVTDEGGITCHAAIVARELKKPCLIGTNSATKIFKDGEEIEVDAKSGIVRKLFVKTKSVKG